MKKLNGLRAVYFETRHEKTLGDLLRLQGADAVAAPALKEVPLENNPEAFVFAEKLFRSEIDILILLTGVGTRTLLAALETRYPKEKILEAWRNITVVPRGPKPIRVLNELKVPYAVTVPEPNTWKELMAEIRDWPLEGKRIAVQEYGVSNTQLLEALRAKKAEVLSVPVYRWALPEDLAPLKSAIQRIIAGEISVVVFTTAVQAIHLFQVAESMPEKGSERLRDALKNIIVASVGPDCSDAIRSLNVQVDVEPESPKMGPLVLATAEVSAKILESKKKTA